MQTSDCSTILQHSSAQLVENWHIHLEFYFRKTFSKEGLVNDFLQKY
jgi:hypothetical protein